MILKVECDVSSMPDYIGHACVDLGAELASELLQKKEMYDSANRVCSNLHEMYFWDARNCWWFEGDEGDGNGESKPQFDPCEHLTKDLAGQLEDREIIAAPEGFDVDGFAYARSDCDQLVIHDRGVRWLCIAKYSDLYFSSATIEWGTIAAIAGRETAEPEEHDESL
jgi:hypothetical protein